MGRCLELSMSVIFVLAIGACDDSSETESDPTPIETKTFELGDATVDVPTTCVRAEGQALEEIRTSQGLATPPIGSELQIAACTQDDLLVLLQHERNTVVAHGGEVVGEFLDQLLDDMMPPGGVFPGNPRVSTRSVGHARVRCVEGVVINEQERIWSCNTVYIDAAEEHLVTNIATCRTSGSAATCAALVESLAVSGQATATTRVLAPTQFPGLAETQNDGFGWLRLGMSHAEFIAACTAAGQSANDPDPNVPEQIRALIEADHFATCSGFGPATSLGTVRVIHTTFHEGRLVMAGIFLDTPYADVFERVRTAYPDYLPERDMTLHFVNRNAVGDQLISVLAAPSQSGPGSLIQIQSRAHVDSVPH